LLLLPPQDVPHPVLKGPGGTMRRRRRRWGDR
jgi:hypothetical protein